MIPRAIRSKVEAALARQAAVALIGPRQVGKTTLAHEIAATRPSIYLDLEATADQDKLADPVLFLSKQMDKLVVLDEIHRVPALFEALRGIIDAGRRAGNRTGRFLILGSAAIDLLRQSGETLAGRIAYVDIAPLAVGEVEPADITRLWLRGGFPDSFLAATDGDSLDLRESFIRRAARLHDSRGDLPRRGCLGLGGHRHGRAGQCTGLVGIAGEGVPEVQTARVGSGGEARTRRRGLCPEPGELARLETQAEPTAAPRADASSEARLGGRERERLADSLAGELVEHGPAPFQRQQGNSPSYFVSLRDAAGTVVTH